MPAFHQEELAGRGIERILVLLIFDGPHISSVQLFIYENPDIITGRYAVFGVNTFVVGKMPLAYFIDATSGRQVD